MKRFLKRSSLRGRLAVTEPGAQSLVLYLDTSALVKLYVKEPRAAEVRGAVAEAGVVATSVLSYIEARSAGSSAERQGTISTLEHDYLVHG